MPVVRLVAMVGLVAGGGGVLLLLMPRLFPSGTATVRSILGEPALAVGGGVAAVSALLLITSLFIGRPRRAARQRVINTREPPAVGISTLSFAPSPPPTNLIIGGGFAAFGPGFSRKDVPPFEHLPGAWYLSYTGEGVLAKSVSTSPTEAPMGGAALRIEVLRPPEAQGWFGLERHLVEVQPVAGRTFRISLAARASKPLNISIGIILDLDVAGADRQQNWATLEGVDQGWRQFEVALPVDAVRADAPREISRVIFHIGFGADGEYWLELGDVTLQETA